MVNMKHNGGGQSLLLLLSSLFLAVFLVTCGSAANPYTDRESPLNSANITATADYKIDILPPHESSLLPFSFEMTEAVNNENLVVPITKTINIIVKYKVAFSFFVKIDIPNSTYEYTAREETDQWFEVQLPNWSATISIFPIDIDLPPYRVKVDLRSSDSITIIYPDPGYIDGYLTVTDVSFPIEGYRVILKTRDGFISGNSNIIDNEFKIPISPEEDYYYLTLYNETSPFFPVFTIPVAGKLSSDLHLYLKGKGGTSTVTISETSEYQDLPYFLSVKGESVYSLSVSGTSSSGEVSGSLLVTTSMHQIRLLSGSYKLFMTPSSTSGYASYVTNVSPPFPGELKISFPPTKLLNITVNMWDGTPLEGAEVDLEPVPIVDDIQVLPVSEFTDQNGNVLLPIDASFPFAFYLIRVLPPESYRGLGSLTLISSQTLLTLSNSNVPFVIMLPSYYLKTVRVVDSSGNPVANAVVMITNKTFGVSIFKGVTDANGMVMIPFLKNP